MALDKKNLQSGGYCGAKGFGCFLKVKNEEVPSFIKYLPFWSGMSRGKDLLSAGNLYGL